MKVVRFQTSSGEQATAGLLVDEHVFSLDQTAFADELALIGGGERALTAAGEAIAHVPGIPLADVHLLAPIVHPPRIFGIGLNYQSHAAETQMKVQAVPTVFMKLASSLIGTGAEVILPKNAIEPDYEAELGVVIGKPGFRIAAADWARHVFGYTIVNDISARDVQLATSQWTLGKSFPTFTPMGPCVVTADEVPDPHALDILLTINGEALQSSNTRNLIFKIPALIEYISSITPLEPGDVISTGTPEGVGMGRKPQRWLQPNEEIVITIDRIGELRNPTRAEG